MAAAALFALFVFVYLWPVLVGGKMLSPLSPLRGYDPPYPSLRLYRLWLLANPGQGNWEAFRVAAVRGPTHQMLNALGARWIVADPGTRIDPLAAPGVWTVYDGNDATVFVNERSAPRAFVARTVELVEGEDAANATLVSEGFDVRRTAVVERDQPEVASLEGAPPVRGRVTVTADENARVELRATLDRRGLVVLDDALFDGWRVEVDGRPAPVVRVDSVMRGVVVDAGTHRVTWRYTVPGIRLGAALSLLAALTVLSGVVWLRVRGRRARDVARPTARRHRRAAARAAR